MQGVADQVSHFAAEIVGEFLSVSCSDDEPIGVQADVPRWKHLASEKALSMSRRTRKEQPAEVASLHGLEFICDDPMVSR